MRVIVSGGGTGGHINPAIAIAKYIKEVEPESEILYVGTEHGLEKKLVPAQNIDIAYIDVYGFKRKLSPMNIYVAVKAFLGIAESKKIIKEFKPDVVIGTGGYVCGPLLQAAVKLKIPTIIHEQNVIPGLTVKMLADKVDVVATSFDTTKSYLKKHKKIVLTGNPVRADLLKVTRFEARIKFNLDEKPTVLIMGGSLGAKSINNALVEIVSKGMAEDYNIIASTGEKNYEEVMAEIRKNIDEIPANITIAPYIYNTDVAFAAADLIVCRTGAVTVSELAATGKPSVVVPSPYVAHNHQEYNARYLSDRGAAVLMHDDELTGIKLNAEILALVNNKELLSNMSKNAKTVAIYDSTDKIYQTAKKLIGD
ncbi:MAG: undecaprenyldiphospho-muramoylpentapeptide beta-N-acetylglucosaminyltransferase [Clostridia bacterium]|nr:undecaprenyldiphospho-muramoylpentapeptide beta-N-acetylglucosaminyltransferase [Clostridia bacterium]